MFDVFFAVEGDFDVFLFFCLRTHFIAKPFVFYVLQHIFINFAINLKIP